MDFFRRWQQTSHPARPSPLGTSQEPPRSDPPRPDPVSSSFSLRRPENDQLPPATRVEYSSPASSSSAHAYLSLHSPPSKTHPLPQHRRDGSFDTQHHAYSHRRNDSQPQDLRPREDAGLQSGSSRDMNHQPSQPNDQPRRTSQGSSGSPVFPGPHEQFGKRQMPPPSPPHSYSSRAQSANVPPTASFLSREPPPSGQSQRPGSSMSISSMLGAAAERPARDPAPSFFSRPPSLYGNPPPSSVSAVMSPPTAPARPSPLEHSLFRRSHTPEMSFSKPQTGRLYRSGSGGGSHLLGVEQSNFGGLSRAPSASQYPDKPHSTHPSPQIPPAEAPYNEPRRMSFSGPIARPSSQPPQAEGPTRTPSYSPLSRPTGSFPDRPLDSGQRSASTSYMGLDAHHGRFGGLFGDRRSEDPLYRDRDRVAGHGTDVKGLQSASYRYGAHYGDRDDRQPSSSTWEHGRSYPPSPETKRFSAAEPGSGSSSGFGFGAIQSYTKSLGSQQGGARQPSLPLQTRPSQSTSPPHESPFNKNPAQPARVGAIPPAGSSAGPPSFGLSSASEDGRRKGSDELLQHRSLLAVGADSKRGGRASPLPQAVQGAQAPFIGPAGESGIKNELGRVFSGIGSGVGGVTAASTGSGPPTPLTSSPFKRDSFTGRSINGEAVDESKDPRPPSATDTRRSRKSRDEDSQMEMDAGDPRAGLSARGARRARHVHHHHHHHHHHRHRAEDDAAALSGLHRPLSSTNFFHRTSTPADGAAGSGTALGHHHHHHHHRHHAPRPATLTAAASPVREPRTTVNLEPLLSSVAHLPRHHLGSTLYNPRIGVPSAKAGLESAKFGYTTTPQPLPRFQKSENCTFTVRVPRFHIDASHREEICARRALWGTGVYTDDSDPVAAAIHSGYIRGAWGEDVDESMLDLEIKDGYQHAPQPDPQAGQQPRLPPVPPRDRDLHITLLILPRLDRYDSTVMFGLKSRVWDGRHDGMSFKVHRVDWVDDGVGRGEERGGEARRKRLRMLMQTGRICTGPAMIKMEELRRNGVQVPRTMDGPDQPAAVQPVS